MANCTILIFRFDHRVNIMLLKSMSLYVVVYLCCILFVYGTKQSFKTRNQACYPLRCSTSVPKNIQSLANEVPALFLPSAIFGHIRSEGALLLCVVSLGFRLFAFPANHERRQPWNTTVNR